MACNTNIQTIQGSECIGDSLTKINNNFDSLETVLCDLKDQVDNLDIPSDYVQSIEAGDGILVDGEPGEIGFGDVLVEAYNSIQYVNAEQMRGVFTVDIPAYPLEDGSTQYFLQFPYNTSGSEPTASFEMISMGEKVPVLTLYWTVTSVVNNFTVYGLTSALDVKPKTQKSNFYPNKAIYASCLDGNILHVGGLFTSLGIAAQKRFRYGMIDIAGTTGVNGQGGGNTSSGGLRLGPIGTLSAVSQNGTTGGAFLDSINNTGFNNAVHTINVFKNNTSSYLAVGGIYTNKGTGLAGGNRFTIFNQGNYNQINGYDFNSGVYSSLSAGNFLYVCGAFTQGKRMGAGSMIAMKGLTRINMTTLEIDADFTNRFNATVTLGGGKYPIYTMAFHNGYLYVGGKHEIKVGKNYSHRFATVHLTDAVAGLPEPGTALETWKPIFNGAVWKLYVDKGPSNAQSMLYAGGDFVTYKTPTTTAVTRTRAAAFLLSTPSTPFLQPAWDPVFNKTVNAFVAHDDSTTSPIYVGGKFTTVNTQKGAYLVAMTKGFSNDSYLNTWKPSPNAGYAWADPGLIRIPTTNSLSGVVTCGSFTAMAGKNRWYVSRIPGFAESTTLPPSAVVWQINGALIGNGGDLSVGVENVITLTAAPEGELSVNATRFEPMQVFDGLQKGDLCRFTIRRPITAANTFAQRAFVIGASIDYSPREQFEAEEEA